MLSVNILEGGKSLCQTHVAHTKTCSMPFFISYHVHMRHRATAPAPIIHQAQKSVNMTTWMLWISIPILAGFHWILGSAIHPIHVLNRSLMAKILRERDVYRLYQHQSIISYRPAIGFLHLRVGSLTKNPTLEGAVSKRKSTSQQKKVSKIMLKTIRVVSSIPAITMFCLVFYLDWISI